MTSLKVNAFKLWSFQVEQNCFCDVMIFELKPLQLSQLICLLFICLIDVQNVFRVLM
jgi:hypothetical protein